jgi:IS1 family transposase
MNVLKPEKKLAVLSALVEGNSIRSTERMTGVHRDTIMRLTVEVGQGCLALMDRSMRDLSCRYLEVDEIWTFVQKKQLRLKAHEKRNKRIGDQYAFVALDAESKLIPCFRVGKRDGTTAARFLRDLEGRLSGRIQLTTDGFSAYIDAAWSAWGADVDFAQLVKMYEAQNPGPGRYSPPRVSEVVSTRITGSPDPERVCTSYVERQNLTIRMACRRFTRLTNAFSKKLENLKAALALHFAYYNFVRIHRSLRVTPAMAAGVTSHVWTLGDLL